MSNDLVENEQVQECAAQCNSSVQMRGNEDMYITASRSIPLNNFVEDNESDSDMRPVVNVDAISLRQVGFDIESMQRSQNHN